MDIIIKTTDGSFDYWAPWGSATHHCREIHGFEFEFGQPLTELRGFGEFGYLTDLKGDVEALIAELDTILLTEYDETDKEVTPSEIIEDVMEYLRSIALEKAA